MIVGPLTGCWFRDNQREEEKQFHQIKTYTSLKRHFRERLAGSFFEHRLSIEPKTRARYLPLNISMQPEGRG